MSWHQDGWSYSAERAWYEPPEYDDAPEESDEMTLAELLEEMRKIAEKIHDNRPDQCKTPRMAETSKVGHRRQ